MAAPHRFLALLRRLVAGRDSRANIEARLSAAPPDLAAPDARWHVAVSHHSFRRLLRATLFADGSCMLRMDEDPPGSGEPLPLALASEIFIIVQLHFPFEFTDEEEKPSRRKPRAFIAVHRRASAPVIVGYDPAGPAAASRLASLLIHAAAIDRKFSGHHGRKTQQDQTKPNP